MGGDRRLTVDRQKETFGGDGNVLYLYFSGSYTNRYDFSEFIKFLKRANITSVTWKKKEKGLLRKRWWSEK